jgi:L-asparagine transporter-like permease
MTLSPRLTRQGKPGLIFFGDIAGQECKQWQQCMLALDPQMFAIQVLEQIYATAYIADRKHKHVRQALRALVMTILLGFVLYVLSQLTI